MRGWIGTSVVIGLLGSWWGGFWWGTSTALADGAPNTLAKGARDTLDKPAFAATASELLAVAKAAPAGDWPAVVLREQNDTSYDDQGRATVRLRWVFVVRTQAAVDDWGTIRAAWRAFYQNKPVVRARVIDPGGSVAELDPALVTDTPAAQLSPTVFSDLRYVDAPLPRLQVGAVVEQEIVTTDREPMSSAGRVDTSLLGNSVPTSSTVISYSAPVSRKIHHVTRKLPAGVHVRHQTARGRESWVHVVSALPAHASDESFVPSDVVVQPYVGVSTAASWEAVARAYRKLLDRRLTEGPVGLPAELPRTPSIETITAITAWLHHQVRYTGIEFGEASYIPWPPAEVAKRGFGDCKDKAMLLVALLRQAGIRADLALLATAPGRDLDPDLPGMGVFDHAIVRARIGVRDIWIDATEDLTHPGQLPARDQGRRALVIADDTKGLSTTPSATPADNLIRDVRTFVAAESGPSQLTEVMSRSGVFEAEQRSWVRGMRGEDFKKSFGGYVDDVLGGTIERVTSSDVEDLATPFEVTLAVKDVRLAYSSREQIDIYLSPREVLDRLPWVVTEKPTAPRTNDFAWPKPHVYEIENRIVMPSGFALPAPPPERIRSIGTATFIERRRIDGQTLIVTFRFETGKPRLTAAELATLQAAVRVLKEETVHIKIEHTAFALGKAGKPREAIAECKRLIALHPTEALHHSQLATVLMRAGAGEAARREARRAVALAPSDADALVVLGWALRFDTLGREYTYDWDRAGSIAALRKAHKLDPKHVGAAVELALVLQRDAFGRRFGSGADLPGAAAAWRDALALEKADEHALALAEVLLWSREFAEAENVARTASETEERDQWIVAAVAGKSGAGPAIQVAGDLQSGASRTALIGFAAQMMMVLQRYGVAVELLAESGALAQMPPRWGTIFKNLTKHPAVKPGAADPRAAVVDLLMTAVEPQRKTPVFWDAAIEHELRESGARSFSAELRSLGLGHFMGDLLQSAATIRIEGDAGLWRAAVEVVGHSAQIYLVLDHGVAKVIGGSDALSGVGRFVLRTTHAKSEARSKRLLDWIRSDLDTATTERALAFKRLWGSGMPASREAIFLAAAALAGGSDPDRVIPVAKRCASTSPDADLACRDVLVSAFVASARWTDVVAQIEEIELLRPDRAARYARLHALALARCGRFDEADHLFDAILVKDPDNRDAMLARFHVAVARGQMSEALRRADAITQDPNVTHRELNTIAWIRLGEGSDLATALDLARKAVQAAKDSAPAINTLAAIEAELGHLDRAITDNWKAMALHTSDVPQAADWYVVGRINEQLGLEADAAAAYQRVAKSSGEWPTSYDLAQKRLAALRVARGTKGRD